jgi:hypothetical protein
VFLYSINSVDLPSLVCYFLLSRDYFACNFSALKTDYGVDLQSRVCSRQIFCLFLTWTTWTVVLGVLRAQKPSGKMALSILVLVAFTLSVLGKFQIPTGGAPGKTNR